MLDVLLTKEQLLKLELVKMFQLPEAKSAYSWIMGEEDKDDTEYETVYPENGQPAEPFNEEAHYSEAYPFSTRLEDCPGVSTRAIKIMDGVGVYTLGDLVGWPKRDITKLRGLGKETYMILTNILRKHKLQWQMWDSPSHKAFKGIQ